MSTAANAQPSAVELELYKLAVEMADRVSARRALANGFFFTLNGAFLAAGLNDRPIGASGDLSRVLVVSLVGVVFAIAWWVALRSYRDLNRAKFAVILELEKQLPVRIYTDEWTQLRGDPVPIWRGGYSELGTVERVVPLVIGALYLGLLLWGIS